MNKKLLIFPLVVLLGIAFFCIYGKLCCNFSSVCRKNEHNSRFSERAIYSNSNRSSVSGISDIAIVCMKDVVSESMGGKSIERQLIEINNSSEKVFSGLEAKVKKIESQQMSPENTKKAEDMSAVLYELVRDKRQQISAAYNIAITTLKENMKKAITEVSQKKNIKLVIDSGFIIYHAPDCWDITKDVIAVMDGMCPEIVVKLKKKKFTNTKKLKDFSELNELADVID